MKNRKEPAKVWVDNSLIKVKPFKTDDVYYLDYSKELYELVKGKRWTCWSNPYPLAWVNGKNTILHHLVLPSRYKENILVDHINRDVRDNRRCNLRYVNRNESGMNRGDMKDNTSGYKGVSYHIVKEKYSAYINVEGKRKYLGNYDTAEEANRARLKALSDYYPNLIKR